jgi:hypothetical protein
MPVLGIIASGVGLQFDSDYELITTTVLTTDTASVTFSSLGDYSSTYKHLQVRATAASEATSTFAAGLNVVINGDTGSNYSRHSLQGNGSSVASNANATQSNIVITNMVPRTSETNRFGAVVIDFLDAYSTTKNKTIRALHGALASGETVIGLSSGLFIDTASMTSINFTAVENLATGSRFSLYGIKG